MEYAIVFACLAVLVRVGLALNVAGLSRSKNAAGGLLRSVADWCVCSLAVWAVGLAIFLQNDNGWFGVRFSALFGSSPAGNGWLFPLIVLATISSGIVAGVVAERSKFFTLLAGSVLLGAVVVPLSFHWASHGWLYRGFGRGGRFFDVAGASYVHVAGGLCAAVFAILVGPRVGKYNRDGSSNAIPGHSIPLATNGALLMFAGWIPYVLMASRASGSDLGATAANVALAGAAGGLTSLFHGQFRYGKPELYLTLSGLLGGLVSITAVGGEVSTLAAVILGAGAGVLVPVAMLMLDVIWKIDDPSGGIAIHAVGGAWGLLAGAGAYPMVEPGWMNRLKLLGTQGLGLCAIALLTLASSWLVFGLLKKTVGLRAREADEYDGLDLAEHDINAYPDFQQTMIKSHHLREA